MQIQNMYVKIGTNTVQFSQNTILVHTRIVLIHTSTQNIQYH